MSLPEPPRPGSRGCARPTRRSSRSCSRSVGSIFRNYNLIIEQVADRDDLEALVLIHQDAEIVDPDFCAKVRAALADPEVAIVGCAGAVDVRSIAWWEGSVTWASFTHRYDEYGGGEILAFPGPRRVAAARRPAPARSTRSTAS